MKQSKIWLWVVCLLIATLGCGLTVKSNPIWIDKAVVTGEIDATGMPANETTEFSPDQPVVYCFVAGHGGDNITVRLKWYRGDELLMDHLVPLGPNQHNYGYLQLKPGGRWKPGEYRVEVLLVDDPPLKVVTFTIRDE